MVTESPVAALPSSAPVVSCANAAPGASSETASAALAKALRHERLFIYRPSVEAGANRRPLCRSWAHWRGLSTRKGHGRGPRMHPRKLLGDDSRGDADLGRGHDL